MVVWGFGPVGVAANPARDLGGRFAAMSLFGTVAAGGSHGAITALMSFPATLLAGVFYELVFNDSNRCTSLSPSSAKGAATDCRTTYAAMNPQWQELFAGQHAEMERKAEGGAAVPSLHGSTRSDEKIDVDTVKV